LESYPNNGTFGDITWEIGEDQEHREAKAALTIQSKARQSTATALVMEVRVEVKAATLIQSHARRKSATETKNRITKEKQEAEEERAKKEAEEVAKEEAEAKKKKEEAEEKVRKEAEEEEKAGKEAEEKARKEAEEKAGKEAEEENARKEAEEKAAKEAEEKARQEEAKTQTEAATLIQSHARRKSATETSGVEKVKQEKAKKEAEEKAKKEAEEKLRKEAEEKAKKEAEEKTKKEAEEKLRKEAEEKAKKAAEEKAKKEAEEKAKREAETKKKEAEAKKEAEEKAKKEAEAEAKEAKAKKAAEAKARKSSCKLFLSLARREFEALDTKKAGALNPKQVETLCSRLLAGLPENSRLSASDRESLSGLVSKNEAMDLASIEGAAVLLYYASTGKLILEPPAKRLTRRVSWHQQNGSPVKELQKPSSCKLFLSLARREFKALDTKKAGALNPKQVETLCSRLLAGLPENSRLSASDRESLSGLVSKNEAMDLASIEGAAVLLYYASTGDLTGGRSELKKGTPPKPKKEWEFSIHPEFAPARPVAPANNFVMPSATVGQIGGIMYHPEFGSPSPMQRKTSFRQNRARSCKAFVSLATREFEALDTKKAGALNTEQVEMLCSRLIAGLPENSRLSASDRESLSGLVSKNEAMDLASVEGGAVLLYYASTGKLVVEGGSQDRPTTPRTRLASSAPRTKFQSAQQAVIKFQALMRMHKARKDLVSDMQLRGTLLAMPGTVQGRSGWYEYEYLGEHMVVRYAIDEEDDWVQDEGPLKKAHYLEAMRMLSAREQDESA
jgi:hypothetical protein